MMRDQREQKHWIIPRALYDRAGGKDPAQLHPSILSAIHLMLALIFSCLSVMFSLDCSFASLEFP